jgi:uncharacterized membrane-anchored protein
MDYTSMVAVMEAVVTFFKQNQALVSDISYVVCTLVGVAMLINNYHQTLDRHSPVLSRGFVGALMGVATFNLGLFFFKYSMMGPDLLR